jgi:predicted N-formylglutamate amidohydrolase
MKASMSLQHNTRSALLETDEVAPVHEVNAAGLSPFLLTCDHYGRAIPRVLGDLGLGEDDLARHIAWDIGIAGVAEALSKQLDAHLIAQRYSRLVIRLQPSAARRKLDRARQRSDAYTRQ